MTTQMQREPLRAEGLEGSRQRLSLSRAVATPPQGLLPSGDLGFNPFLSKTKKRLWPNEASLLWRERNKQKYLRATRSFLHNSICQSGFQTRDARCGI